MLTVLYEAVKESEMTESRAWFFCYVKASCYTTQRNLLCYWIKELPSKTKGTIKNTKGQKVTNFERIQLFLQVQLAGEPWNDMEQPGVVNPHSN